MCLTLGVRFVKSIAKVYAMFHLRCEVVDCSHIFHKTGRVGHTQLGVKEVLVIEGEEHCALYTDPEGITQMYRHKYYMASACANDQPMFECYMGLQLSKFFQQSSSFSNQEKVVRTYIVTRAENLTSDF